MFSWILSVADRNGDDADAPIIVRAPSRHEGLGQALRRAFEPLPSTVDTDLSALLARLG